MMMNPNQKIHNKCTREEKGGFFFADLENYQIISLMKTTPLKFNHVKINNCSLSVINLNKIRKSLL